MDYIKNKIDYLANNYDWDMLEVDRNIDVDKAVELINSEEDDFKRYILKLIINNTIYVNFETLKDNILSSIQYLPDKFNLLFYPARAKGACVYEEWCKHHSSF
jgi:hypothetical protein